MDGQFTLADEHRLSRRRGGASPEQVAAATARLAARRAAVPAVSYPEELPVAQHRDEIARAIRDHQVVIVAGETGSGKTTQLPKICLELGRGVRGLIGHTQPRRIAARTVAERVAEELGTPLGEAVGYQVRFTGHVGASTLVKLMTDGILLAETQHDRLLLNYDTIIVDEAHERSLNIDFLLGYLKQLLPRRPDLKVVITSATIDPDRFATHFADAAGTPAPVITVSGRTYPVEVRYRPPALDEEGEPTDQLDGIVAAVGELSREGPGDILVFLSGEREIRDTADALKRHDERLDVLPLFARLSAAEQHRVFQPHTGRRVVLATNVAETSLTVPGIHYVIDPGTARVSRYSQRLKVQRLPIEPVSQASANQRKGRCGRLADGICIRLYDEDDFNARPEFTDPEILRTNLASVILQMAALDLGDVAAFPFVEPPDRRSVNDGAALLQELGAFTPDQRRLTPLGRQLAQLPVDPRLGRMVLAAQENGCVREVLVIAAALSIQDPRERPLEQQGEADARHARFKDPDSDFIALLNLWRYLGERQAELSSNQFRKLCRAEFLNYLRVREWQDLESQLRQITRSLGIHIGEPNPSPDATRIHQSLLPGLLSQLGMKDIEPARQPTKERRHGVEYTGARGARFAIFPGSALSRKTPAWVMAAELVETSRLWARVVAKIEPQWAERAAAHLVKRSYSEPHWEARQGSVMALEKVTLYGLPLATGRKVHYGRIDPVLSRELFIRHALVEGDWQTRHEFFHHNRALLAEVEELEHRARRRDISVDDETLFRFYDERVGAEVVSGRHFDSWWKRVRPADPDLLDLERSLVPALDPADYPDHWHDLHLTYQFEPGTEADGVTAHVPLASLNQVDPGPFEWQIPGLRRELVIALLRSLPKPIRRDLVPVPDHADAALAALPEVAGPLLPTLAGTLRRLVGVVVDPGDFDWSRVPDHLRITFKVAGEDGATVAEGKDLAALKRQLAPKAQQSMAAELEDVERHGLTEWNPGTLAQVVNRRRVTAYPALVDEQSSVGIKVFATPEEQARAMTTGTRRLLLLEVPTPIPVLSKRLSNAVKLGLTRYPYAKVPDLLEDCVAAAVDAIVADHGGPSFDDAGYSRLRDAVRAQLPDRTAEVVVAVEKVVAAAHEVRQRLGLTYPPALAPAIEDMRTQFKALMAPGFVTAAGRHLGDLPRYLRGIGVRLDRATANPARDQGWMSDVDAARAELADLLAALAPHRRDADEVRELRWMIEELRISLFAQELRTPYPVSLPRLYRAMDALR